MTSWVSVLQVVDAVEASDLTQVSFSPCGCSLQNSRCEGGGRKTREEAAVIGG